MHDSSYRLMSTLVGPLVAELEGLAAPMRPRVLDVGARDLNGTYRPIFDGLGWQYWGADLQHGPNVDVLVSDEGDGWTYLAHEVRPHLIVSGQQLEHDREPWRTVSRFAAALVPGGIVVLIAPFVFPLHHPPDYWRFTPAGLGQLLAQTGRFDLRATGLQGDDAFAIATVEP